MQKKGTDHSASEKYFVLCCVERFGYLMEETIYHFMNRSALQRIDFALIFYFIWKKDCLSFKIQF